MNRDDKPLRDHLHALLEGGHAHAGLDAAVADLPPALRGEKPAGSPHSPWQLLEHLRLAQWDILEFSRDAKHVSPKFPDGYWPRSAAPPDDAAWEKSVASLKSDLATMQKLVAEADLYTPFPGATARRSSARRSSSPTTTPTTWASSSSSASSSAPGRADRLPSRLLTPASASTPGAADDRTGRQSGRIADRAERSAVRREARGFPLDDRRRRGNFRSSLAPEAAREGNFDFPSLPGVGREENQKFPSTIVMGEGTSKVSRPPGVSAKEF